MVSILRTAILALLVAGNASAQSYPAKPIKLVVISNRTF
jgi:tripartite-type tricarboxylate transporter receptor subunit TctC